MALRVESVDSDAFPTVDLVALPSPEVPGDAILNGTFGVSELGRPRPVDVIRLTGRLLAVTVVVDTPPWIGGDDLRALQAAAVEFVLALPEGTDVAVADTATGLIVAPSQDRPTTADAVAALAALAPGGATLTAAQLSAALDGRPWDPPPGRAVVLLHAAASLDRAQHGSVLEDWVRSSEAPVYVVTLGGEPSVDLDPVAEATGGWATVAADRDTAAAAASALARDVSGQCLLRFTVEHADLNEVEVRLTASGVSARAVVPIARPGLQAPAVGEEGPSRSSWSTVPAVIVAGAAALALFATAVGLWARRNPM